MKGLVGKQDDNQATDKKGACICFSRHTTRKAMGQSVDLLKLSLKIEFGIYPKILFLFRKFSRMWNYLSFFVRNREVFSRGICNTRKITNFLDKDNTEQKSIITLQVYSCFDKRFSQKCQSKRDNHAVWFYG